MKFLIYIWLGWKTLRQNASTCIEVDKHNEQIGRDVDSNLGFVDTCLDLDI